MKLTIIGLGLLLGVSGCRDDDTSRAPKIKAIRNIFPNSRIFYMTTGSMNTFYVIDTIGQLYEIHTGVDPVNWQLSSVQRGIEAK